MQTREHSIERLHGYYTSEYERSLNRHSRLTKLNSGLDCKCEGQFKGSAYLAVAPTVSNLNQYRKGSSSCCYISYTDIDKCRRLVT